MRIHPITTGVTAGALYFGCLFVAACGGDDGETTTNTVEICPSSMTDCGGECVDTANDPAHCGACGDTCGSGQYCGAGTSADLSGACPAPLTDCTGTCTNTNSDPANCGSCGAPCDAEQYCAAGTCTDLGGACAAPLVVCGGICTNTDNDNDHCGGCNAPCTDGEKCNGSGVCALTCQTGFIDCGGTCIDPNTNNDFCGASSDCQGTDAGAACGDGEKCNGSGVCALTCQTGHIDCNGTCIDPTTHEAHCGASGDCQGNNAGATCGGGEICSGSACVATCGSGLVLCGTSCVDPSFDPAHCGVDPQCAGGAVCKGSDYCDNGTCTPTTSGGSSCATSTATTSMPSQSSTYSSNVRGYYFVALSDFIITAMNIPTVTGAQSIQVMRMNSGPPPIFPTTTTNYTTLAYIKANPSVSFINVCIPVFTGDRIGILGQRNTTTSYATGPATVTINGDATSINRFQYQGTINTSPAGGVSQVTAAASFGRIELQTAPM